MKNHLVTILEQLGDFIATWQEAVDTTHEAEALDVVWLCHEMLSRTTLVRLNPELLVELPTEALDPWERPGTMQHRFCPSASSVADAVMALAVGSGYIDLVALLEEVRRHVTIKEVARRAGVPYSTAISITSRTSEPAVNLERLLNAALPTYSDEALADMNALVVEKLREESEAYMKELVGRIDALQFADADDEAPRTLPVGRRLMVNANACTRAINPRWVVADYDVCEVVKASGKVYAYLKGADPFKEVRVK